MTVAQCEQMFTEKGYQDAGNARQQAARGTYDPAYLNYTMGKLMIRKLRADWAQSARRRAGVEAVQRRVPVVRRSADSAGARADAEGTRRRAVLKQVIVVNEALKLPRGKLAAQVAHASVAALLEATADARRRWVAEGMPKVVLRCESEQELLRSKSAARGRGITECADQGCGAHGRRRQAR